MALSIQFWANYTRNKPKLVRKSENSVQSDHVLRFVLDTENHHISSNVQASMRDRSYRVEVDLDEAYGVSHSSCDCPLGNYTCHHVAATLLFGYKRASKTDVKCRWIKNPKSIPKAVQDMETLFPVRKPNYREVNDSDREFMFAELNKLGRFSAQQWLLSPEPANSGQYIQSIEDMILSKKFNELSVGDTQRSWLRKALILSPDTISKVISLTVGQRKNPLWSAARKHRITASNFDAVLGAIKRNSFTASLQKRLLSAYNLEAIRSVSWGINHEIEAVKAYNKKFGTIIEETGIWLHESGVLGASPDGVITQQRGSNLPELVEIKCPYRAREMKVCEAASTFKDFCLVLEEDNSLTLRKDHDYYHQIQGQLHITHKISSDLVIWTCQDLECIRVTKDISWCSNLNKLVEFYFERFIPTLLNT